MNSDPLHTRPAVGSLYCRFICQCDRRPAQPNKSPSNPSPRSSRAHARDAGVCAGTSARVTGAGGGGSAYRQTSAASHVQNKTLVRTKAARHLKRIDEVGRAADCQGDGIVADAADISMLACRQTNGWHDRGGSPSMQAKRPDVIVVGGGNAALCAALRKQEASVHSFLSGE